jgi:hypothetical protein
LYCEILELLNGTQIGRYHTEVEEYAREIRNVLCKAYLTMAFIQITTHPFYDKFMI